MRSISIVYKKPAKEKQKQQLLITGPVRRSVDEYYSKLAEKQRDSLLNRGQPQNRIRSSRPTNPKNQVESLNIASINFMPSSNADKRHEDQKEIKKHFTKKNNKAFFSIKSLHHNNFIHEKEPHGDHDLKDHTYLKTHVKVKPTKDLTLVLSADFILNELNFWEEEEIDEPVAKYWKTLQMHANLVWVIKRANTLKKIVRFTMLYNLRLDGVYQIQNRKKKKSLTISYHGIESDLVAKKGNTGNMIAVNGLRVDSIKGLHYSNFVDMLPVVKAVDLKTHFIKIDILDKGRFQYVLKVLSRSVFPQTYNVDSLLLSFQENEQQNARQPKRITNHQAHREFDLNSKIELLKKQFMSYFSQSLSLNQNDKVRIDDTQSSVQYVVGDMLKRNCRIFEEVQRYTHKIYDYNQRTNCLEIKGLPFRINKHRGREQLESIHTSRSFQKFRHTKYHWPVYIWKF